MYFTRFSSLLILAGVATAHFTLDYPTARGFDEDKEPTAPCGGFDSVSATRSPFPLGDAYIRLTSTHSPSNVLVLISFVENPTDIKNFTLTASGTPQTPLRDFFQVTVPDVCIGVDVAAIGYPNVTDGTKATIAIQYEGGDGNLYQCADVILSSSATVPSNVTCSNEYTATVTGAASPTGSASGSASPSASTTTRPSGAGRVTIGMGLGSAVMALLGAVLHM